MRDQHIICILYTFNDLIILWQNYPFYSYLFVLGTRMKHLSMLATVTCTVHAFRLNIKLFHSYRFIICYLFMRYLYYLSKYVAKVSSYIYSANTPKFSLKILMIEIFRWNFFLC
ncbi:hypothetical protein HanRHA438_Chr11g0518911 [Helianthus annuus]|nr:hypothetical protein HanRHA438_Chr11g0518911 [Helianthus annuus]